MPDTFIDHQSCTAWLSLHQYVWICSSSPLSVHRGCCETAATCRSFAQAEALVTVCSPSAHGVLGRWPRIRSLETRHVLFQGGKNILATKPAFCLEGEWRSQQHSQIVIVGEEVKQDIWSKNKYRVPAVYTRHSYWHMLSYFSYPIKMEHVNVCIRPNSSLLVRLKVKE